MIPKVIHYCWFSGEEKPQSIQNCLNSWPDFTKGYEIKEWTLKEFDPTISAFAHQAFIKKKWAFVADYFRLWVLYNYGGIYLDSDVILHKSFDNYLKNRFFISWETLDLLGPHVLGSEKGHPLIKLYLDYYSGINFIDDTNTSKLTPIPYIITPLTVSHYGLRGGFKQKLKDGVNIYPINIFTINNNDGENVAEHLFASSWKDVNDCNYLNDRLIPYYKKYSGFWGKTKYISEKLIKKLKKTFK